MGKNIVLKNARGEDVLYQNVDKISVKDTENNHISFASVEGTFDILKNGKYDVSSYENVNVNITSLETGLSTIPIPDALAQGSCYTFKFNNDTILCCGEVTGSGVWVYHISSNSWEQIYDKGQGWNVFQIVGDKCLISEGNSLSAKGLLLYDSANNTVIQLSAYNSVNRFCIFENKCLMSSSGSSGVHVFNFNDNTYKTLRTSGTWTYLKAVDNKCLLCGNSAIVLVYNPVDDSINEFRLSGSNPNVFQIVGDKCLIGYNSNSSSGIGIYNTSDSSVTQLYSSGGGWNIFKIVGDKCLIGSSNNNGKGVLLYNANNNTITEIFSSTISWNVFQMIGDKYLIGSKVSSSAGLLLYDIISGSITQIDNKISHPTYFQIIGDKCLIGCTGYNSGLNLYKSSDNTITNIYNSGGSWGYFQIIGDKCLIGSSDTSYGKGVLVYDSTTDTVTQKFNGGSGWIYFRPVSQGCYISNFEAGKETAGKYILFYNIYDDSIKIHEYYVKAD